MQPWPFCSFGRLRAILTASGCHCILIAQSGALTDINGELSPALYGFTRDVNGVPKLAPIPYRGDDDIRPRNGHQVGVRHARNRSGFVRS